MAHLAWRYAVWFKAICLDQLYSGSTNVYSILSGLPSISAWNHIIPTRTILYVGVLFLNIRCRYGHFYFSIQTACKFSLGQIRLRLKSDFFSALAHVFSWFLYEIFTALCLPSNPKTEVSIEYSHGQKHSLHHSPISPFCLFACFDTYLSFGMGHLAAAKTSPVDSPLGHNAAKCCNCKL